MGANQGRTKGNLQKAEYENRERKHGKPGFERTGKTNKAKAEIGAPKKPLLRQKRKENGKEETEG